MSASLWIALGLGCAFGLAFGKTIPLQRVPLRPAIHPLSIFALPIGVLVVAATAAFVKQPQSLWGWMIVGSSVAAGMRLKTLLQRLR